MGELFDKILKSDESIFLNPQFLDYDYQPKLVPFRETQQQHVATAIKPLLQRRNGKNLIILGKPGVGKTVSLKHVLGELEDEYSNEVYCIYVNCWKRDTSSKVIHEICQQLNYKWTHNKNFEEMMNAAAEIINEKSAVIVLDEVDKLQEQNIIYSMLEDFHRRCLILITNETDFITKIDNRIKSRLMPDVLEFKPYTLGQIEYILKQRVEYAFIDNALEKEAFDAIIKKTNENGDMRAGLYLLKQSGEMAENASSKRINLEHVNKALMFLAKEKFDDQEEDLKELVSIIKENSGKTKNEIFKLYEDKTGKSLRTFQRRIKELEDNKIISISEESGDFIGKQYIIKLNN